jgi:DNA polymerase V
MKALDTVNDRFGKGALQMASAGIAKEKHLWSMKQQRKTPSYTTNWTDILEVRT